MAVAVVGTVLVLAMFDLIWSLAGWTDGTISGLLLRAARHYPIVPFALAVMFGHVFGGGSEMIMDWQRRMGSDMGLFAVTLFGLVAGAMLWQNK